MKTFEQLGIPFPLFEAPIEETDFIAVGKCDACGEEKPHCFRVDGITDTRPYGVACYECIREGRAYFVHDTELGLVNMDDAQAGVTQGLPEHLSPEEDYEAHQTEDDEWVRYRVDKDTLLELVRTPNYITWQGDNWLFHHKQPMIYVGVWGELTAEVPESLKAECEAIREENDGATIYVFRCVACGEHRVHYDFT